MIYYCKKPSGLKNNEEREAALALLSKGLQEEYEIHTLPVILREENGKPYFSERNEIHFNYSHSKTMIACGISRYEIGVDIEDIKPIKESLIRYVCHERELEYVLSADTENERSERMIMLWTMKEAYVKYHGTGLKTSFKAFDLSSLLLTDGNGLFEGKIMQVKRVDDSYLSVYSEESFDLNLIK